MLQRELAEFDLIMDDDLAENKYPERLTEHQKMAKQSLMAQVMNRELFEKLKDTKTEGGWTIARAINTAGSCMNCARIPARRGRIPRTPPSLLMIGIVSGKNFPIQRVGWPAPAPSTWPVIRIVLLHTDVFAERLFDGCVFLIVSRKN